MTSETTEQIRAQVDRYAYSEADRVEWAATEFLLRFHPNGRTDSGGTDVFASDTLQSCLIESDGGDLRVEWWMLRELIPELIPTDPVDQDLLRWVCDLAQDAFQITKADRYNRQLLVECVACAFDTSVEEPNP